MILPTDECQYQLFINIHPASMVVTVPYFSPIQISSAPPQSPHPCLHVDPFLLPLVAYNLFSHLPPAPIHSPIHSPILSNFSQSPSTTSLNAANKESQDFFKFYGASNRQPEPSFPPNDGLTPRQKMGTIVGRLIWQPDGWHHEYRQSSEQ